MRQCFPSAAFLLFSAVLTLHSVFPVWQAKHSARFPFHEFRPAYHAQREKKLDEDKRLIDETNQKMEENEDELLEIPRQIRDVNRKLMLQSMGYFYEKIRVNKKESDDIDAWINQVRVDLKKNIIRKQNRDINNREIYAYLHDIFGPSTLDLFDIHYEDEDVEEDSAQNKQNDTKESQKEEES